MLREWFDRTLMRRENKMLRDWFDRLLAGLDDEDIIEPGPEDLTPGMIADLRAATTAERLHSLGVSQRMIDTIWPPGEVETEV